MQLADGKADAAAFLIHADDLDLDLVPNFQSLAGVFQPVPGNFREVHKPVGAADAHKGTKLRQAGHAPGADITFMQVVHHLVADHVAGFVAGSAFAQDEAMAFAVHFNNADVDFLANHFLVLGLGGIPGDGQAPAQADLRRGDKAADGGHWHEQAALVVAHHGGFKTLTGFQQRFRVNPALFFNRADEGEDQVPVLVFWRNNIHWNGFSNAEGRQNVCGDGLVFLACNQAFGFRANANQNLSFGQAGDNAVSDFAGFGEVDV